MKTFDLGKLHIVSSEKKNSNNGWGFGGSIYTEYVLSNGIKLLIGERCYRHAPSSKLYELFDDNGIIASGKAGVRESLNVINRNPDTTPRQALIDAGLLIIKETK